MHARRLLPVAALLVVPLLAASGPPPERTAVAVLRFQNNTSDAKYDNLGRALATMMVSDLSVVDEIQLVERERMEDLLAEMKLQESGYVDPETAQTVGLMVGAEYVVTGGFSTVDPDMVMDTRIVRVETSEIVKTAEVAGPSDDLFGLQESLAETFIEGLALVLTDEQRERLRAQQEANRIGSVDAALKFSLALCLLDAGAYVEGFEAIQDAREAAPGSALVQATFDVLRDRVEEEAANRLKAEANRRIGGLLGRRRAPEPQPVQHGC